MEHITDCPICLEVLNKYENEGSCETPCCLQTFHRKCINNWLNTNKKCPMCREKMRSKVLLFPIRERTDEEYKEAIIIRKNRSKVLENIRERNEDTVYIDEIEDEDAEDDGMPGLISRDDPGYYDSPVWNVSRRHYIGASAVQYLGLQLPAVNADYDDAVDNDGLPELVPMYYDDGLDSLLVPNVIPNIELATIEDLIITPEINIMGISLNKRVII